MRFKKLITPLLITVIICATLALGYQQDPLLRLPNPFSGAGVIATTTKSVSARVFKKVRCWL